MKTATYHQPEAEGNRVFTVAKEYEADGVKLADLANEDGAVIVGACPVTAEPVLGACTINAPAKEEKPTK